MTAEHDEGKRRRLADVQKALAAVEARRQHDPEPAGRLGERLAQMRAKISGDKRALAELTGAMERLASEMDVMRAKAAPEPVVPVRRSPRLLRRLLLAFGLAIAATGVVLLWLASRLEAPPSRSLERHPADPAQAPPPPSRS